MAQPLSNAAPPEVHAPEITPEVPVPVFTVEIPREKYANRERYAARDVLNARDGVLRQLRSAISLAATDGRTVSVSITIL